MALRSASGMVLSAQLNTSRPPRGPRPIRSSLVQSIPSLTILGGRRASGWSVAFLLATSGAGVDFLVGAAAAMVGSPMTSVPGFLVGPTGGLGRLAPTTMDFHFSSTVGCFAAGVLDLGSRKCASRRARREAILAFVSGSGWSAGRSAIMSSAVASLSPSAWAGSGSGSVSLFPANKKRGKG